MRLWDRLRSVLRSRLRWRFRIAAMLFIAPLALLWWGVLLVIALIKDGLRGWGLIDREKP